MLHLKKFLAKKLSLQDHKDVSDYHFDWDILTTTVFSTLKITLDCKNLKWLCFDACAMWTAVFVGKSQLCPMGVVRDIIQCCLLWDRICCALWLNLHIQARQNTAWLLFLPNRTFWYALAASSCVWSTHSIVSPVVFWLSTPRQNTTGETKLAWYTAEAYQKRYD